VYRQLRCSSGLLQGTVAAGTVSEREINVSAEWPFPASGHGRVIRPHAHVLSTGCPTNIWRINFICITNHLNRLHTHLTRTRVHKPDDRSYILAGCVRTDFKVHPFWYRLYTGGSLSEVKATVAPDDLSILHKRNNKYYKNPWLNPLCVQNTICFRCIHWMQGWPWRNACGFEVEKLRENREDAPRELSDENLDNVHWEPGWDMVE
jgi:hypothetical protein